MSSHALDLTDNLFELIDNEPVVKYVIMQGEHVAEAVKVLSEAFQYDEVKEPPNDHVPHRIFIDFYSDWMVHFWHKNTFVVAMHKYNGSLIGLSLGEDYDDTTIVPVYEDFLYDLPNEKPYIDQILTLCTDLKQEWINQHRSKGPIFYLEVLAVERKYRNRGIATQLVRESVKISERLKYEKNFHTILAECANNISLICFQKCGFRCIRELKYKDWEYPKNSGQHPLEKFDKVPLYDTLRFVIKDL